MMINARFVPCILKSDALERGIVNDIISHLSKRFVIQIAGELKLSQDDVISYKDVEWHYDKKGSPRGVLRKCILEYEAARIMVIKLYSDETITYHDLTAIKGCSFLPSRCAPNSVRGFFKDRLQDERLVSIDGITLERLPNGTIVFPRNIIHIPDCEESEARICSILKQGGIWHNAI